MAYQQVDTHQSLQLKMDYFIQQNLTAPKQRIRAITGAMVRLIRVYAVAVTIASILIADYSASTELVPLTRALVAGVAS